MGSKTFKMNSIRFVLKQTILNLIIYDLKYYFRINPLKLLCSLSVYNKYIWYKITRTDIWTKYLII
jgi:hypothetical protein